MPSTFSGPFGTAAAADVAERELSHGEEYYQGWGRLSTALREFVPATATASRSEAPTGSAERALSMCGDEGGRGE